MTDHDIREIQDKVTALGRVIDAPARLLTVFGISPQNGTPHIEMVHGAYHLVVAERGVELSRTKLESEDALLYELFQSVTFAMASKYELSHRDPSQDSRVLLFEKQLALLKRLSSDWADRRQNEIDGILVQNPYVQTSASHD